MLCLYAVSSREAVRQISLSNLASFPFHGSPYLCAVTILFASHNEWPNYGLAEEAPRGGDLYEECPIKDPENLTSLEVSYNKYFVFS